MIRTVWLTIACLAVLAALLVGKALKTPVALATVTSIDETTIAAGRDQDRQPRLARSRRYSFISRKVQTACANGYWQERQIRRCQAQSDSGSFQINSTCKSLSSERRYRRSFEV